MHLSPREIDKLYITQVGQLAQKRLARGLALNYTEAVALISHQLLELIRDGQHSVADLMSTGKQFLGRRHVMPGVEYLIHDIQIEGTFPDGTKLVTIHDPICTDDGNLELALYGSYLPIPSQEKFPLSLDPPAASGSASQLSDITDISGQQGTGHLRMYENSPGAVITKEGTIELNQGKRRFALRVTNDGDRPIQVGSHYHFVETNRLLRFDRQLAYGKHLDIPSGTAVRFEPGDCKTVSLVEISGNRVVSGGNNLISGPVKAEIGFEIQELVAKGFSHELQRSVLPEPSPRQMLRAEYALAYGPTTGDRVRLGDSDLWLEVEKDYTVYGDECVFGGGKVLREGMGQSTFALTSEALDLVLTNALIIDYHGVFKADIGVKNGVIVGIGKAGNQDVMANVDDNMIVGATTEVLSCEGKIVTAGALDTHIHYICPQICKEALSSGITTLVGGGTGPNTGTCATTCTPGKRYIQFMLEATDQIPLNFGFTGKGNCASIEPLLEQIQAGAVGLKLHEDWGTTPSAIDTCLTACDQEDVQVTIHTDTLNESGFVEDTIAALKGRTIHAYHSEGAGGGHAPDIIRVCSLPNVIPSSTNPTRPFTKNTIDEHLDMLLVCHHLDKNNPDDISFAESRIREETIAAEDVLHDIGAISVISSDSQAMGRVGEVICRTWQTANKMKKVRGHLSGGTSDTSNSDNDNFRIKRYIAKCTINPAIAHGISHVVGSIEVGKLADLVLWEPAFFGTKPEKILKGGMIVWSQMGDANASIPTPQPVIGREMFAANHSSFSDFKADDGGSFPIALAFVSQSSIKNGNVAKYSLKKRAVAIKNCRKVGKADMKLNSTMPSIKVDPETFRVEIDGELYKVPPAQTVCLSKRFYIY